MAGETENLVLELLRGLRGDMDGRFTAIETRPSSLEERIEAVEPQIEGRRYVFVAAMGPLATGMKEHDARIVTLEGTRV